METQEDTTAACKTTFPSAGTSSGLPSLIETSPAADGCDSLLPPTVRLGHLLLLINAPFRVLSLRIQLHRRPGEWHHIPHTQQPLSERDKSPEEHWRPPPTLTCHTVFAALALPCCFSAGAGAISWVKAGLARSPEAWKRCPGLGCSRERHTTFPWAWFCPFSRGSPTRDGMPSS